MIKAASSHSDVQTVDEKNNHASLCTHAQTCVATVQLAASVSMHAMEHDACHKALCVY